MGVKGFNRVCRACDGYELQLVGVEGLRWVRRTLGWCRGPEMGVNGIR